jgi:hypothetical protein
MQKELEKSKTDKLFRPNRQPVLKERINERGQEIREKPRQSF